LKVVVETNKYDDKFFNLLCIWLCESLLEQKAAIISKAYSSIGIEKCKLILSLPDPTKFDQVVQQLGWTVKDQFIIPVKMSNIKNRPKLKKVDHLSQLVNVTLFLQ
jgi:hypothetical protein